MKKPRHSNHDQRHASLFPQEINRITQSALQRAAQQRGLEDQAILALWSQAVGDMLAPHTTPVRLIRNHQHEDEAQGSVLVVKVTPVYATLLMHQTEMILQRLHQMLGYRPAQRIKIQR
jgi:hypothetical protein